MNKFKHWIIYGWLLTFSWIFAGEEFLQIHLDHPQEAVINANSSQANASSINSTQIEGLIRINSFAPAATVEKSYAENLNLRKEPWELSAGQLAQQKANEVFYRLRRSWSESEDIDRHIAGLFIPYDDNWSFGFGFSAGFFHLDDGTEIRNGNTYEGDLLALYRLSPEVRFNAAVGLSYAGDVLGPSLRAGGEYSNRSGLSFSFESRLWVPWTDNTISAEESGRDTGMSLRGSVPLRKKLVFSFDLELDSYDVAESSFSSRSYEGIQAQVGGRLGWEIWGISNRRLSVDFISPDTFTPDSFNTSLVLYASVLASKYFDLPENNVVPVTPRRLDQRIGVDASVAFNSFSGIRAGVYTGYDPERKIDFLKLYGFYSQLALQPFSQLKIYADFGMDSEVATGIAEGKTWYYGGGINYKF